MDRRAGAAEVKFPAILRLPNSCFTFVFQPPPTGAAKAIATLKGFWQTRQTEDFVHLCGVTWDDTTLSGVKERVANFTT